jgi:hypothetical protein
MRAHLGGCRALVAVPVVCIAVVGAVGCKGQVTGGPGGEIPGNPPGPGTPGGSINPPGGSNVMPVPPPPPGDDRVFFASAIRRLTKGELRQTIVDLTGLDLAGELAKFPEDFAEAGDVFAFDNKYAHQQPSAALIEAARNLADVAGARVLSDAAVRQRVIGCTPTGAGDQACLRGFITRFGRRALRRPLTPAEIDAFAAKVQPLALEANDFNRAVALVVRAMLQNVEFLYRTEIGQPVAGVDRLFKLTGPEVATRLSFLLWGTAPDDGLLDSALAGDRLGSPQSIRAAAERMLADPRARRGVGRFHALWLGYERTAPPASLAPAMNQETQKLIEKVVFEDKRPWRELFTARETYVDAALAAHYGLPAPAGAAGWVSYGASGRQGILSHGTFLGVERKHEDTSPTMRGHFIRTRLLCAPVPPPPPNLNVDIDAVPSDGNCKSDRYNMWQKDGCKACHALMDPIGFGLERFDRTGKARTVAPADAGKTGCELTGRGEFLGAGAAEPFEGVAGLSDRLVDSGALERCLTTQLASFMLGREPRGEEVELFSRVAGRFTADGQRFDRLLLDLVSLPGFGYRVAE